MTLEDRERLVACPLDEMTALFPGYTYAELRMIRHGHQKAIAQRSYRHRNTRQRGDPTNDNSEQWMREDAERGSRMLRDALFRMVV